MSASPEGLLRLIGLDYVERPNRLGLCCPFHNDTDPSAGFYLDTELFHCFACGFTFDLVTFYQRYKGIETRQEAQRDLEQALGESRPRKRGNPVHGARIRAKGEARLAETRDDLSRPIHAYLGEQLDRAILFYERGHLSEEEVDKRLEIWYNKVTEAQNGTDPRGAPGINLDARIQERMGNVPRPDEGGVEFDLD